MGLEKAREKIGNNVQRARLKAGYKSIRGLAEHLSFSHTKLTNIERGLVTASIADLREIAQVLKVPVESLQVGDDQRRELIIKIQNYVSENKELDQALDDIALLVQDSLPGFELAYAKNLRGKVLLQMGKNRKAATDFQLAKNELISQRDEDIDSSYLLFKISANTAVVHYNLHEYKSALKHAGEARDCASNQVDRNDMVQLQALCYAEMEEYDAAHDLYESVLKVYETMDDEFGIARTVHSIGDLYNKEGEIALAENSFRRSLLMAEGIDYHRVIAGCAIELSKILFSRCEFENACSLLQNAITTSLSANPPSVQADLLYRLSCCTFESGEKVKLLERAFIIAKEVENSKILLEIGYALGNYHELAHDIERASRYYKIACKVQLGIKGSE